MTVEFILYVADQRRSTSFYSTLLSMPPALDVPGMTEFSLPGCKLGLMAEKGIARIISGPLPDPASATGIPRCEIYLQVEDLEAACARAEAAGAAPVSAATDRDWGDRVAYYADPDGHVIALSKVINA